MHDGIGIWLAARRLHHGHFVWPSGHTGAQASLSRAQLDALVLGLPWQRIGEGGIIAGELNLRAVQAISDVQAYIGKLKAELLVAVRSGQLAVCSSSNIFPVRCISVQVKANHDITSPSGNMSCVMIVK